MNTGKCPKCDSVINACVVEDVNLLAGDAPRWRAFSYSCPSCKTVLGVQMNPLTLNVDLANLIKAPAQSKQSSQS
jgi:hypothetical protein